MTSEPPFRIEDDPDYEVYQRLLGAPERTREFARLLRERGGTWPTAIAPYWPTLEQLEAEAIEEEAMLRDLRERMEAHVQARAELWERNAPARAAYAAMEAQERAAREG